MQADPTAVGPLLTVPQKVITQQLTQQSSRRPGREEDHDPPYRRQRSGGPLIGGGHRPGGVRAAGAGSVTPPASRGLIFLRDRGIFVLWGVLLLGFAIWCSPFFFTRNNAQAHRQRRCAERDLRRRSRGRDHLRHPRPVHPWGRGSVELRLRMADHRRKPIWLGLLVGMAIGVVVGFVNGRSRSAGSTRSSSASARCRSVWPGCCRRRRLHDPRPRSSRLHGHRPLPRDRRRRSGSSAASTSSARSSSRGPVTASGSWRWAAAPRRSDVPGSTATATRCSGS